MSAQPERGFHPDASSGPNGSPVLFCRRSDPDGKKAAGTARGCIYEAGTDTLEEYQERKTELLEQITALKETKKEEQEVSVSSCSSFSWNYHGLLCLLDSGILTGTEANELLRLMLSRILFNRPEGRLQLIFRF